MKKILFLFCVLPTLAFSQIVLPGDKETQKMIIDVFCLNRSKIIETIKGYEEEPIFTMNSIRKGKNNETISFESILFVNVKTGSWTFVEEHGEKGYCITALGTDMKFVKKQMGVNNTSLPKRELDTRNLI
jgi:hypothetical protein